MTYYPDSYDINIDDMNSISFFEAFEAPIADYFDDPEAELDLDEDDYA